MKLFRILLGVVTSAFCLYLSVRQIDFSSLGESFGQINIFWMLLSIGGILASQWFRSVRWARLLKPVQRAANLKSFQIYSIGNLANLLIPLRGGDVIRAWIMANRLSERKSAVMATVVTERLVDLIVFGFLLGLSLWLYPVLQWVAMTGIILFSGSLSLGILLALVKADLLSVNFMWKTLSLAVSAGFVTKIQDVVTGFFEGVAPLATSKDYLVFVFETILMWGMQGVFIYLLFHSFGFTKTYDLGINATLLMLALTTVAVTVPSSPSYAGTLHLMIIMSLEICGLPATEAFSYAVVSHMLCTVAGIILGIYGLMSEHLKLDTLFFLPK